MNPVDYELVTSEVVAGFRASFPRSGRFRVRVGARCRILGLSGYKHQIDVSLELDDLLLLVECKCLGKPIGVAEVLVFASRMADIAPRYPDMRCAGVMASQMRISRNASKLAERFNIGCEVVRSASEYGFQIGNAVHQGVQEVVLCAASVEAEVLPKSREVQS